MKIKVKFKGCSFNKTFENKKELVKYALDLAIQTGFEKNFKPSIRKSINELVDFCGFVRV